MAEFSYNGHIFGFVLTKDFQTTTDLEPSGVDEKYIKVRIVCQFVFAAGVSPNSGAEAPAAEWRRLKEDLMAPRKPFSYANAGESMISIPNGLDLMLGPIPQYCHPVVEHSFGPSAWVVEWCVECAISPCGTNSTQPFLTCRWSQSQDVDERGYSTVTTNGRATVNPTFFNLFQPGIRYVPDTFRGTFIPPLLSNFERKYHYMISENALEYAFTITDTEKLYNPPPGMVKVRGKTTLTTTTGALFYIQASSEVVGKKLTPKSQMVALAFQICADKLVGVGLLRGQDTTNKKFTIQATIDADMDTDTVRCMLRAKAQALTTPENPSLELVRLNLINRFNTPDSAIGNAPADVGYRGSALLQIASASLGDPCTFKVGVTGQSRPMGTNLFLNAGYPSPGGFTNVGAAVTPNVAAPSVVQFVSQLPPADPLPTPSGWDQVSGMTEGIEIQVSYDRDYGKVPVPVSGNIPGGNSVVVVQMNNPVMRKTFSFSIMKAGLQPSPPDVRSYDPNLVLLSDNHTPCNVNQAEDGTLTYTLTGSATYVILNPNTASAAYPLPPWMQFGSITQIAAYSLFPAINNDGAVPMTQIDASATLKGASLFPPPNV